MAVSPFDFLKDYLRDRVDRDRKNTEFIHTQTDNFITWIIGFSFTGLLLAIANINNLQLKYRSPTKPILICLLITIVLGIAFRYISFLTLMFQKSLDDYFFGLLSEKDMSPIEVNKNLHDKNFDEMLIALQVDFDEEIKFAKQLNDEEKEAELPKLKEHYVKLVDHARKSYEIFANHFAEVYETAYKVKEAKTLKILKLGLFDKNFGYNVMMWDRIKSILYTLCLLSFLIAVFITCFALLFMK